MLTSKLQMNYWRLLTGNLSLWMILMWTGKTGRSDLCRSWTSVYRKPHFTAKKYLPWLSKELNKSIICVRKLAYKSAKKTGASQHFLSYKRKRNEVVKLMKKAKRKFFQGLNTPNSKNFWKVATFLSKKNSSIPTLKNRETIVENDFDKATLLNC